MNAAGPALIDAIALAIAKALAAHGVSPADGNGTIRLVCGELCRDWGGGEYWIPQTYRAGRDAVVVEAVQAGASVREAARRVGVHPDTARAIVRRQSAGLGRDEWVL